MRNLSEATDCVKGKKPSKIYTSAKRSWKSTLDRTCYLRELANAITLL